VGDLDDPRYTREDAETIKYKVQKLISSYGLASSDAPDVEQELALHVSIRMAQHDPSRGARSTFVDRVVVHKIANILEHRHAQKRGMGRQPVPLDELPEDMPLDDHVDQDAIDRRIDVQMKLSSLPPDLLAIATRLMIHSPAEVARQLGLTRGQIRQRQGEIRRYFVSGEERLLESQPRRGRFRYVTDRDLLHDEGVHL